VTRLADEYFKRDLSEAEEQQLSNELASSSEDAQLMAERMGEIYTQTGLPEPVWQNRPLPSSLLPGKYGTLKIISSLSLILALAGVLSCWYFHRMNPSAVVSMPPMNPSDTLQPSPASGAKTLHPVSKNSSAVQDRVSTVVAPSKAAPGLATAKAARSTGLPLSTAAGQSGIRPVPSSPGRTYQELSVVVNLPQSALATVRVYDHLGNEIRMLYAGILPQGKRTFAWDGKDEAGLVAPPGVYTIEVKSGEKVMRQEVHVEADQTR
jgi:hypothetical protein